MRGLGLALRASRPTTAVGAAKPAFGLPTSVPRRLLSQDVSRDTPRSIAKLLEWKPEQAAPDVVVNGFVRSVRAMKSHAFVTLGDGSSLAPLQALLPGGMIDGLVNGAAVRLKGSWVPSPAKGQSHELHVEYAEVLGPSNAKTFPLQKKYQTPEFLRTIPHLRPRLPINAALLRFRSEVISCLNQFFVSRDFVQTHPPLITSSDCEGAGEVFTVAPASEVSPRSESNKTADSFFRSPKYLTVSTQLHLEALAQSVGNVWTLSPTFRAEKSDTSRHLSEFYMLEAEMCFVDNLGGVMDLAEDMLRFLATNLHGSRAVQELLGRSSWVGADLVPATEVEQRWKGLMQASWPRITYTEAIDILADASAEFEHKPEWGVGLQTEHEKYLTKAVGGNRPVFVTHYPRDTKAFYMLPSLLNLSEGAESSGVSGSREGSSMAEKQSRATVDCFDLLVPEFCEIAGGSMREHRLPQLLELMRSQGLLGPQDGTSEAASHGTGHGQGDTPALGEAGSLDWYLDLRRWGCPPHGGFGLGFDRLLSYLWGVQTIRDAVAFPRWYGRCDC